MELRHLRYAIAVAEAGSFVQAAARLRVAQPALSRQIHNLERKLGVDLFERSHHGARLTAEGAAFVERAKRVVASADELMRATQEEGMRVRVTLGALEGVARLGLVSGAIRELHKERPHANVTVRLLPTVAQMAALAASEIDVSIGAAMSDVPSGIRSARLFVDPLEMALVREGDLPPGTTEVRLRDLAGMRPIIRPRAANPSLFDMVAEGLRAGGVDVDEALEASDGPTAWALVLEGMGWELTTRSLVVADVPRGLAPVHIRDLSIPLAIQLYWRRGDERQVVQALRRAVRSAADGIRGATVAPGDEVPGDPPSEALNLKSGHL